MASEQFFWMNGFKVVLKQPEQAHTGFEVALEGQHCQFEPAVESNHFEHIVASKCFQSNHFERIVASEWLKWLLCVASEQPF